jgi:hypothetical protein
MDLNPGALGVAGISVDTLRQLYCPGTLVSLVMGADCLITVPAGSDCIRAAMREGAAAG